MISLIIPTFNEAKNIKSLIYNLVNLLRDIEYEIIIVDDDSPDGTAKEVSILMEKNKKIQLINRVGRCGLSSAIKEGLIFAKGNYSLVLDGDGQHDSSCVLELINKIKESKADIVIASRFLDVSLLKGLSDKRSLGSKLANRAARISLSRKYANLTDYLSGCFCIKNDKNTRLIIRKIQINGFKFLYELLALSKGLLIIEEVPLIFKERIYGTSKLDLAIVWDFLISILHNISYRVLPRRAISFGLVGISGVVVQLFITLFLTNIFLIDFKSALPFSVVCAATSNFLINNQLTFRTNRLRHLALLNGLLKFLLVASLPVIANVGIATAFYQYISADTLIAQLAGIAIVYAWNYLASSLFVWNNPS
tara:strand:+ start:5562 stop:6656 length:1095 start_codon:yes stop_codon:yes gene_type:complete